MKLIIISLASLISFSSFAQETKCETCEPLIKLSKSKVQSKRDLKKIQDLLMSFEFSKDSSVKSQEARAYLQLVLKARNVDNTTTSAEYFYNFYDLNRETFDAEIQKLDSADQKTILNDIKGVGELRKGD